MQSTDQVPESGPTGAMGAFRPAGALKLLVESCGQSLGNKKLLRLAKAASDGIGSRGGMKIKLPCNADAGAPSCDIVVIFFRARALSIRALTGGNNQPAAGVPRRPAVCAMPAFDIRLAAGLMESRRRRITRQTHTPTGLSPGGGGGASLPRGAKIAEAHGIARIQT